MDTPYVEIRMELCSAKQAITQAFLPREQEITAMIAQAVEVSLTEVNLGAKITEIASKILTEAVENELRSYYRNGEGRVTIGRLVGEATHGL